jgi:hypothetical protein
MLSPRPARGAGLGFLHEFVEPQKAGGSRWRLTGRREITDTLPLRRENQPATRTAPAIRAGLSTIQQHRRTS